MKSYKLDIKEMTETFNNSVYYKAKYTETSYRKITQKQMSEMVQKHALKLGLIEDDYVLNRNELIGYIFIDFDKRLGWTHESGKEYFDSYDAEKIGLEFFSIKPEKFVNVRMLEEDYMFLNNGTITDKWELLK